MPLLLRCRFHEKVFPDVGDLIMACIKQCNQRGVYVKLLEYDHIEGIIPLSEVSHHRFRNFPRDAPLGTNVVLIVIRVNKERGYIDLSKRRVTPEDIKKCENRFQELEVVHGILSRIAGMLKIPVLELYEAVAWPLAKLHGSASRAFRISTIKPEIWDYVHFASPAIKKNLVKLVTEQYTPSLIKLRAHLEVKCFGYGGIDAIKEALRAGEAAVTESISLKVKLVAPPLYILNSFQYDEAEGVMVLENAIEKIKKSIEAVDGGSFKVVMEPRLVTDKDDEDTKQLMKMRAVENLMVSADEDDEIKYGEIPVVEIY